MRLRLAAFTILTSIACTAVAQTPGYDEQYQAARALIDAERYPEAVQAFSKMLEASPRNSDLLLGRATANMRMKKWAEAEADLRLAHEASPNYTDVTVALANVQRWRAPSPELATAAGYTWSAGLSASRTHVGDQNWRDYTASIRHYFTQGSLGFEVLDARRFGLTDKAYALDGYTPLWSSAYANVRYQRGPNSRLFPANSWRAEVFQSIDGGWELSGGIDDLGFDDHVKLYSVGVGKYTGNFYLRWRHQNIVSTGSHSSNDRLMVRYYDQGDADNYMEVNYSNGRSGEQLELSTGRQTTNSYGVSIVRYVTPDWSVKAGASLSRSTNAPNERSISVGLSRRW
ncbi:YaiO family outer membrane beta-barrel protein [Pseudoduganella eburnea]|uniref:YaiO family outer membrane beta-barrel protein n=1 Tax=Massilia eburnea TaxID=1776165 RepID=A0A6L6QPT0_9BURK|nr:YaiO family outer membrane beta-barrel protein [Massilia eburnea]MTW14428.1 YaiO family outer membrane beta-barrel protein [Massilia eburnea]